MFVVVEGTLVSGQAVQNRWAVNCVHDFYLYRIVASSNARYKLGNQLFVKRSQNIRIENPLHKQSEKASMCF